MEQSGVMRRVANTRLEEDSLPCHHEYCTRGHILDGRVGGGLSVASLPTVLSCHKAPGLIQWHEFNPRVRDFFSVLPDSPLSEDLSVPVPSCAQT